MAADVYDLTGLLLIFLTFLGVFGNEPQSLYAETDNVVILDSSNLVQRIHNSETGWVVEFYNSWCGHCIRFAPLWKKVGTDVKGWESIVRIGAIDCAVKENVEICSNYDISGYPTIKTFPSGAPRNYTGQVFDAGDQDYLIRHEIIRFVEGNHSGLTDQRHHLKPLKDLNEIWQDQTERTEHTVVLFEDSDSFIGREAILDVSAHPHILVRRMLKSDVVKYGVHQFPSAHLIDKEVEGKFTKIATMTDRKGFRQALLGLIGLQDSEGAGDGSELKEAEEQHTPGPTPLQYKKYDSSVHMQDLLSGLYYSLRLEVPSYKTIEGEALEALKKYTDVLAKYFPGSAEVVEYLRGLHMWIHDKQGPVPTKTWIRTLDDLQAKQSAASLPGAVRWTGCAGSGSRYRGYPCSLWTLFHTLTVQSATHHSSEPGYSPQEVLLAMRGYITNFFGCQECRENFNRGAVHIEAKVTSADESILFLWRSHNRANYHLSKDPSEDPAHPKLQFPPPELCPRCHKQPGAQPPSWDERAVLAFLKDMYSRENLVQDVITRDDAGAVVDRHPAQDWRAYKLQLNKTQTREVVEFKDGGVKDKVERWKRLEYETRYRHVGTGGWGGFGMTGTDLSICILFYIICTLIIILLCFHFTVQKRMRLNICRKNMILPL